MRATDDMLSKREVPFHIDLRSRGRLARAGMWTVIKYLWASLNTHLGLFFAINGTTRIVDGVIVAVSFHAWRTGLDFYRDNLFEVEAYGRDLSE